MQSFIRALSPFQNRLSVRVAQVSLVLALLAQSSWADALQYTKNYFVTGDYKVAGVGLRGKGGADGLAAGTITMADVPSGADIVAAFLYWETEERTALASSSKGYFDGKAIVGDVRGSLTNPVCWSSGGTSSDKSYGRVYRADVLRYLTVDATNNVRIANGPHTVKLRDSGGNGNGNVIMGRIPSSSEIAAAMEMGMSS